MKIQINRNRFYLTLCCATICLFFSLVDALSLAKGKVKSVQKKKNRREPQTPIIACSSAIELERAIDTHIRNGDNVLEFGAQFSDATKELCRRIGDQDGKAVLVDIQRSETKSGRNKNRDLTPFVETKTDESFADRVTFVELEKLDFWRRDIFSRSNNKVDETAFDAIILDLGAITGNDLPWTSLELINDLIAIQSEASMTPRVILVKSKSLSNLARRLVHCQRLFDGSKVLSSSCERSPEPYIISTVGVDEYRRTIPYTVEVGDSVLEVGCHFGRTTRILNDAARSEDGDKQSGYCIGIDIGPKIIASAKKQYPDIPFAVGNAWRTLDLLKLKKEVTNDNVKDRSSLGYDIVYADIGGLSGSDGLLESLSFLDALANALEPRFIVIKSMCMKRLSSRLRAFSDVWATIQKDEKV